jgi:hypothetical protein
MTDTINPEKIFLSNESTTTTRDVPVEFTTAINQAPPQIKSKDVQRAVYAYIQAIRVLGRTEINTIEIADALALPIVLVNQAAAALRRKGVRELHG